MCVLDKIQRIVQVVARKPIFLISLPSIIIFPSLFEAKYVWGALNKDTADKENQMEIKVDLWVEQTGCWVGRCGILANFVQIAKILTGDIKHDFAQGLLFRLEFIFFCERFNLSKVKCIQVCILSDSTKTILL